MEIETQIKSEEINVKTLLLLAAGFALGYVAGCLVAFSLV